MIRTALITLTGSKVFLNRENSEDTAASTAVEAASMAADIQEEAAEDSDRSARSHEPRCYSL